MFVQVAVREEDAWCTGREVRVVACADDGLALFLHLMRALIPHVRVAVGAGEASRLRALPGLRFLAIHDTPNSAQRLRYLDDLGSETGARIGKLSLPTVDPMRTCR